MVAEMRREGRDWGRGARGMERVGRVEWVGGLGPLGEVRELGGLGVLGRLGRAERGLELGLVEEGIAGVVRTAPAREAWISRP